MLRTDFAGWPQHASLQASVAGAAAAPGSPTEQADMSSTTNAKLMAAFSKFALPALTQPPAQAAPPPLVSTQLKGLVRLGVPHALRPSLWLLMSGGYSAWQTSAVKYSDLVSPARLPSATLHQLESDVRTLHITFKAHPIYSNSPPGITALTRILVALLNSNRDGGYSRQLCHMAAFCMVIMGGPSAEEAVFWTLRSGLAGKLLSAGIPQQMAARVETAVLSQLAARKLPRLTSHLASLHLDVASVTGPWMAGLFVTTFAPETTVRVWDCALCEGPKVMLRTGLALLKLYETTLMSCSIPEVLRKVMDLRVSRCAPGPLLACAFRGCGSLPGSLVTQLRTEVLRRMQPVNAVSAGGAATIGAVKLTDRVSSGRAVTGGTGQSLRTNSAEQPGYSAAGRYNGSPGAASDPEAGSGGGSDEGSRESSPAHSKRTAPLAAVAGGRKAVSLSLGKLAPVLRPASAGHLTRSASLSREGESASRHVLVPESGRRMVRSSSSSKGVGFAAQLAAALARIGGSAAGVDKAPAGLQQHAGASSVQVF